jgi:signal recognition particle subunit SRP54
MTPAERRKPDLINGARRKRIAKGSGVEVSEVNKLLKMHRSMADMAKAMGKGKMPFGGGMPGMMPGMGGPNLEQLKQLGAGRSGGNQVPGGLPGLPGSDSGGNSAPSLPGLPSGQKKS